MTNRRSEIEVARRCCNCCNCFTLHLIESFRLQSLANQSHSHSV